MSANKKELIAFALLLLFGIAAAVILCFGSPLTSSWFPQCPFHLLTGLQCPGCGSTRGAYYLVHCDVVSAFRYQPLFVSMLPVILLLIGKRIYELLRNTTVVLPYEWLLYRLILIAVCVFFVLRNVPMECFERLRPPI